MTSPAKFMNIERRNNTILYKLILKIEEDETHSYSDYEASVTLKPRPDKDI